MEFDQTTTAGIFVAIIVIGTAAMIGSQMMSRNSILMMVTPSMTVFGLVCLALGVKHGEHRAGDA